MALSFCSKDGKLSLDPDRNQGAINKDALLLSSLDLGLDSGVVVRSETDNEYGLRVNFMSDTLDEIDVDFDQYSVLGFGAMGTCEVQFIRNVTFNNLDSTVTYLIRVNELGNCERAEFSNNWVLVPRIGDGYEVFFEKTQRQ